MGIMLTTSGVWIPVHNKSRGLWSEHDNRF
jgi:hypothetical protein